MHAKPVLHWTTVPNVLKTEFPPLIVFALMENTMLEIPLVTVVTLFTVWLVKLKPITVKNVSQEDTPHQNAHVTMELGIITVFVNHVLTNALLVVPLLMTVLLAMTKIIEWLMMNANVLMDTMMPVLPIVPNVTSNVKPVTSPIYV
jgi:hypothetical protein